MMTRNLYDDPSAQSMHMSLKPGDSLKPHLKPVDAVFYVLDGNPAIHIYDESISQVVDTLTESPANILHHISYESQEPARIW
jgi:mannose-6-phosphate isomerase-like protein (cupin superfamily)